MSTALLQPDELPEGSVRITLRRYLLYAALAENPGPRDIHHAYAMVTALVAQHPRWNLNEERTWLEWVAWDGGRWSWADA